MKHVLRGLERHGIGTRALCEDDFYRICAREDIEVVISPRRFAYYLTAPSYDLRMIVLPQALSGLHLLFAQFHELAHHLLHGGDDPCIAFLGESDKKCEAEADAVAVLSIFPSIAQPPAFFESALAAKLWDDRLRLYQNYGIE